MTNDPRLEYVRTIGDAWKKPFDDASLSDSTFTDGAHDGADVEITFGDHITIAHARRAAEVAADNSQSARTIYIKQLRGAA
jgi:hypothetical protein